MGGASRSIHGPLRVPPTRSHLGGSRSCCALARRLWRSHRASPASTVRGDRGRKMTCRRGQRRQGAVGQPPPASPRSAPPTAPFAGVEPHQETTGQAAEGQPHGPKGHARGLPRGAGGTPRSSGVPLAQLERLESSMAEIVKQSAPEILKLRGVGPVPGATILAEVGDVSRFGSADEFASYCGGHRTLQRQERQSQRQLGGQPHHELRLAHDRPG